jgi:hypothetical protein
MSGNFHIQDVGQRVSGRTTQPAAGNKFQLLSDHDPDDAAALLFHKLKAGLNAGSLAAGH